MPITVTATNNSSAKQLVRTPSSVAVFNHNYQPLMDTGPSTLRPFTVDCQFGRLRFSSASSFTHCSLRPGCCQWASGSLQLQGPGPYKNEGVSKHMDRAIYHVIWRANGRGAISNLLLIPCRSLAIVHLWSRTGTQH